MDEFMTERSLLGKPQLSIAEVEQVARAFITLADIFCLDYLEVVNYFAQDMSSREYQRICDELEMINGNT